MCLVSFAVLCHPSNWQFKVFWIISIMIIAHCNQAVSSCSKDDVCVQVRVFATAAGGGAGWRRRRRRDERASGPPAARAAAAAVRRRGALRAAVAAVRVPLAALCALAHRWLPARGGRAGRRRSRAPVAERRSSCARVVLRLHIVRRDAAARAGAGPAAKVGLGLGARPRRAQPTERVQCERKHSAGAGCTATSELQCEQCRTDGARAQRR